MEVLINEDYKQVSAWYQYRPSVEKEIIQIRPKKVKTRKERKSEKKRNRNVIPRISIKRVKARAYTNLGTSIGASMGYFRIN